MNASSESGPSQGPRLTVWPTGQRDLAQQLTDRGYQAATPAAPTIPPAVAAHAIAAYSRPGQTVLDPACGAGTVLAEALLLARHAIGVTDTWDLARAEVRRVKASGALGDGMVLDVTDTATPVTELLGGQTDLVLTMIRKVGGAGCEQPVPRYASWLRPGGNLVLVSDPALRAGGEGSLDVASALLVAGRRAGLTPVERCVALTGALRDGDLHLHPSGPYPARPRTPNGTALSAHLDVIVLRHTAASTRLAAAPPPCAPNGELVTFFPGRDPGDRHLPYAA